MIDRETEQKNRNIVEEYLGTDEEDYPVAVMDFAVYGLRGDREIDPDDKRFYITAVDTIISAIDFIGDFVIVSLDFKDAGVSLLKTIADGVDKFHKYGAGTSIMVSQIVSFLDSSRHNMALTNPLACIRGYSPDDEPSPILTLIYAAENVMFYESEIDRAQIHADVDREILSMAEAMAGVQEDEESIETPEEKEEREETEEIFTPDLSGIRGTEDKYTVKKDDKSLRIAGKSAANTRVSKIGTNNKVGEKRTNEVGKRGGERDAEKRD